MTKFDLDDKDLIIIAVFLLLLNGMWIYPPAEFVEVLKIGFAGLFGLAVGTKGQKKE